MKKSRLSYDEWKCILLKELSGTFINSDFFDGYIGLIKIIEVNEAQIWKYNGQTITVCDKGMKWLSILPRNDHYCITAMFDTKSDILLWYIDIIMAQGINKDGVPYFEDLYLDLIIYPDGTVITDDMDELEEALSNNNITQEQFEIAIFTGNRIKNSLVSDMNNFKRFTQKCLEMIE